MDTLDMLIYGPEDYEVRPRPEPEMARHRLSTPGYITSTKGHSVLRNKWGYGGRAMSPVDDLYLSDIYRPRHSSYYDSTGTENEMRRNVNRELLFSTHAADDAYDMATKSRNRDQEILREASNAIPPSKSTPAAYDSSAGRTVSSAYAPRRRFQTGRQDSESYRSVLTLKPPGTRSQSDLVSSSIYRDIRNPDRYELRRRLARESPIRSPTISPYQSPRESPDRELGQDRSYRRAAPGRVGSSYNRQSERNYPSYDVDDFSDVEDTFYGEDDRDKYLNYPIRCDDVYAVVDDVNDDGQSTTSHISNYYVPARERSPSPVEYMAYQPRKRRIYDDDEKSETPPRYTSIANIPLCSRSPYRSALDVNKSALVQSSASVRLGSSVANDVMFHDLIAQTAAKARQVLKNVNLDEYDSAALVFSVEGEMKDPVRGKAMGFEYVARPLMLKGPMLAGPASAAIRSSDHDFRGYLNDLSNFRQGIKDRLASGYSALSEAVRLPRYRRRLPLALDYEDDEDTYGYGYSSPILSRRKRLGDYSYGERLNLFPLHGSRHRALTPDASYDQFETMDMYEPDAEQQLTTLEKIKIKVNTETHASPKAAVASRRARSHGHFTYHHPTAAPKAPKSYHLPPPKTITISTPSQSYVRRPRKEVVVVSSFSRPRPASATDSIYRVFTKKAAMADWYHPSRFSTIPHYNPWWPYYTAANQLYHSYSPIRSPRVIETVYGPKVSSPAEMYANYFSVFPSRSVNAVRPYPARYRLYGYDYPTFHRRTARFLAIPLVHKRKYIGKAALVGSRVDVVTPKSRKPKSEYAAKAIRRIRKEEREQTSPEDATSSSMSASKPVSTTSTRGGKAIRDIDGYTQPKNVLSWQYRIESRVDPEDIIEVPKTYAAVRKQMKGVQCKMDKHRQLMDRYLEPDLKPETEDVKSKIMNLYVDMEQRNPSLFRATGEGVTSSSTEYSEISTSVRASSVRPPPVSFARATTTFHGDDSDYSPMSDVRRRVRSVIRKNKRAASVL